MINIDAEKIIFTITMISLNSEISIKKIIMVLVLKIDSNDIYTKIVLIEILLQFAMIRSKIRFLQIIIIYLIYYLIIFIFKEKYSLMLCYKYF